MIFTAKNTHVLKRTVQNDVFISFQSENDSCAVLEPVSSISDALLSQLNSNLKPRIIKIISNKTNYHSLEKLLFKYCKDIKFIQREFHYELYYRPMPASLKVSVESQNNISNINKKIKVLIIDDSKTICNLLTKIISMDDELEVVGTVNDPLKAEDSIKKLKPDVLTLDIHMPNMNGVELLKKINPIYKIPTIMISSISIQEGPLVLDALENGAMDYIQKPDMANFSVVAKEINFKIKTTSKAIFQNSNSLIKKVRTQKSFNTSDFLVVIGASTGGTKALQKVLEAFPSNIPPVLIVQHIPAEFSKAFADRLNTLTPFLVKEAQDGDEVVSNQILIAAGGKQMRFISRGNKMFVELNDDDPVNRFKPSVDYLFNSVADSKVEKYIVSAIFTGMGNDGAAGMKYLKEKKHAITIAQNESSCVVFGMPKEAIKTGSVDHIVDLEDAAASIIEACSYKEFKKAL